MNLPQKQHHCTSPVDQFEVQCTGMSYCTSHPQWHFTYSLLHVGRAIEPCLAIYPPPISAHRRSDALIHLGILRFAPRWTKCTRLTSRSIECGETWTGDVITFASPAGEMRPLFCVVMCYLKCTEQGGSWAMHEGGRMGGASVMAYKCLLQPAIFCTDGVIGVIIHY